MSDELKPCPFCGGKAEMFERYRGLWNVHCTDDSCGATIDPAHRDHADCLAKWNRRFDEHPLVQMQRLGQDWDIA